LLRTAEAALAVAARTWDGEVIARNFEQDRIAVSTDALPPAPWFLKDRLTSLIGSVEVCIKRLVVLLDLPITSLPLVLVAGEEVSIDGGDM
jgi:hypothetical protein